MPLKWKDKDLSPVVWNTLKGIIGEHPELQEAKLALERMTGELEQKRAETETELNKLKSELEQTKEDRLQWMARESSVRKDLQECRDRSKDLLEQVVRLTHQQREAKKNLLDQEFKTNLMPLERNRYEMELVEARAKARKADEQCKEAQEQLAGMQARISPLEQEAKRVKELESKHSWAEKQRRMHEDGLNATIAKLKDTEARVSELQEELRQKTEAQAAERAERERLLEEQRATQARATRPQARPTKAAPQHEAAAPQAKPSQEKARRPYRRPELRPAALPLSIDEFLALPAPAAEAEAEPHEPAAAQA